MKSALEVLQLKEVIGQLGGFVARAKKVDLRYGHAGKGGVSIQLVFHASEGDKRKGVSLHERFETFLRRLNEELDDALRESDAARESAAAQGSGEEEEGG